MLESRSLPKFACNIAGGRFNGWNTFINVYGFANDLLRQCEIATSKNGMARSCYISAF